MLNVLQVQKGYTRQGAYGVVGRSGTMAADLSANSEVFHFRWTATATVAVIRSLSIWAGGTATAFTAGPFLFRATIARSWSADGSGGTVATVSGNNGKLNTGHPSTGVGTIRVASTGALGTGTKTNDANGFRELGGSTTATAGMPLISPVGEFLDPFGYPPTVAAQEGIVVTAVVPATGTWQFGIAIRWEETAGFPR